MISQIESRFLEVTGLPQDISLYPLTELVHFPIRKDLSKSHGEVFTPLSLVDRMLETSQPSPSGPNLDLCAGRGQFTVRLLRRFVHLDPLFDPLAYLRDRHWFNELNPDSALELLYIFGPEINLALGPAQALSLYPHEGSLWKKGLWRFCDSRNVWFPVDSTLQLPQVSKPTALF